MESINITKLVMKNLNNICIPGLSREYITEYYVSKNLNSIIGRNIVLSNNAKVTINNNGNESSQLYIETIFYKPIKINICKNDNHAEIKAESVGNRLFTIVIKDDVVSNDVNYQDGSVMINEYQEVVVKDGDANRFSLSRKEDDELVYSGSLIPISSSSNRCSDYFSFVQTKSGDVDHLSLLKSLFETYNANSIVEVQTSRMVHQLSKYVDPIYSSLTKKLESTRVKKNVNVKKRLMAK